MQLDIYNVAKNGNGFVRGFVQATALQLLTTQIPFPTSTPQPRLYPIYSAIIVPISAYYNNYSEPNKYPLEEAIDESPGYGIGLWMGLFLGNKITERLKRGKPPKEKEKKEHKLPNISGWFKDPQFGPLNAKNPESAYAEALEG